MEKISELKYKYTFKDYLKASGVTNLRTKKRGRIMRIVIVVAIVIFLLDTILLGIYYNDMRYIYITIFYTLMIIFECALMIAIYHAFLYVSYKKDKRIYNQEITIEFYKDYIIEKTDISTYKLLPENIFKLEDDKNNYYIKYLNSNQ